MAISDLLCESLRKEIDICNELENYDCLNAELNSLRPILKKQKVISNIPKKDEFLIEIYKTKDFSNLFVFTLDGKFVNEGIAFLWALRLAKLKQTTFSITANDFGFSLTTAEDYDFSIIKKEADYFFDNKKLEEDLENAINFSELTIKLLSLQKNLVEFEFIFSTKSSGFILKLVNENLPSQNVRFDDLLNLRLDLKLPSLKLIFLFPIIYSEFSRFNPLENKSSFKKS